MLTIVHLLIKYIKKIIIFILTKIPNTLCILVCLCVNSCFCVGGSLCDYMLYVYACFCSCLYARFS